MIDPLVNTIVVGIFGLIIGGTSAFAVILSPLGLWERASSQQEEKKGKIKRFVDAIREALPAAEMDVQTMSRDRVLLMIAFGGLLIVLMIIIRFSAIEMRWGVFLVSLFAGVAVIDHLFASAVKGKRRITGRSVFDVLPQEKQSGKVASIDKDVSR